MFFVVIGSRAQSHCKGDDGYSPPHMGRYHTLLLFIMCWGHMAGRCLRKLLVASTTTPSVPPRLRSALPSAFSSSSSPAPSPSPAPSLSPALAHNASSGASSDFLTRHRPDSGFSCLRANSSFSIIDAGPSATHIATRQLRLRSSDTQSYIIRSLSTKAPADTEKPKSLEDFQHEEIVGPTVERDESPVTDELRSALDILQKRMLSFQKLLVVLGGLQGAGAVWCYVSWHTLDPTWQLVPSAVLSLLLAFVLRQALQPISFFGKLEERSRLRIITLSLMIAKGFSSFFNRARILVAASALGVLCVLLYNPSTYLLGLLGILK